MKEKLLVLAKAAPEISSKYEHLVCVAGITESGEWRRIYPIPWKIFWESSSKEVLEEISRIRRNDEGQMLL
ncbi:MAG: hypothetical protein KGH67_04430 [Candidatus Micrarchaeota archaeon]|nr:hypothetical protein [Candidatus Micrarchaeota archaeon]MDE1859749.1 hypothetical protein [Candidatus Micrarchaeota archaeon]